MNPTYKEFSKIADMRAKCPADDYYWFSRDVNQSGQKTFFAIHIDHILDFEDMFSKNNHIYEILPPDQPIRPYFDLEMCDTDDYEHKLQLFKDWLSTIMENEFSIKPEYLVLSSCTETKLSYHLLITNAKVNCVAELKPFMSWLFDLMIKNPVEELMWLYGVEQRTIFDKIPYGTNQNFRMVNQSKYGKTTVLQCDKKYTETMVRMVSDTVVLNCSKYSKKKNTVNNVVLCDGLNEKQVIYRDELNEYLKYNMLNDVALKGTWEDWRNMGFALHNTFGVNGISLFQSFSMINTLKYDEKTTTEFYSKLTNGGSKRITFNTIRGWAKKKDPTLFKRIFSIYIDKIEDRQVCETDNDAGDAILILLQDKLIYSGRHYYKMNNIWLHDADLIHNSLLQFIMSAPLYKPDAKGNNTPYWQNYSSAEKLVKTVLAKSSLETVDNSLFHSTTKYRLCFLNGVLDFQTKQFYTWDKITFPYYSTVQIPYDYKPATMSYVKKLMDNILEPLFNDNLHTALRYLARSIAGCIEDKNFATYEGNRDCGKGVFNGVLKRALHDYIQPLSIINLLCVNNSHLSEKSVDYFWLLELEFARLAISQEIPAMAVGKKLKSDLVKHVCSGGDVLSARRNFDRKDTHFTVDCSLLLMGNCSIPMEGDILEHHVELKSAVSFKSEEYIEQVREQQGELCAKKYRKDNPNIKTEVNDIEYSYAMIHILLENFTMEKLVVHNEFTVEDSIITKFMNDWEIINDKSVSVRATELSYLGGKIKNELAMIGIECKKNKSRDENRDKLCFFGIKRKETAVDSINEL